MSRRTTCLAATTLLAGCRDYASFQLPPAAGARTEVVVRLEAQPAPVLEPGPAGGWDSVDVLNPAIVKRHGVYHNFYSGFDGKTWHTGLAVSADGVGWSRLGRILSPEAWEGTAIAANGSALVVNGAFWYWYQAGEPPRLALARSADGRRWKKVAAPVLETGPRGSWDERGVADPYVIRVEGLFYLFYLGQDRARRQRLGVARSVDGVRWEKLRANPILGLGSAGAFDENGVGEPAVWSARGSYWMLYTGRDRAERRRLGLARSIDGIRWRRVSEAPVLAGTGWFSQVVCDPEVEVTDAGARVWFGGGDVAHPAENIHGRIGLAVLRMEPK